MSTERGEWEAWLSYFLAGVAGQADDALSRVQRIDDLMLRWREQVSTGPSRLPERAIDLFAENPFWTVNGLAGRFGVAFTTAQRAIDRLESTGIVAPVSGAKRNRVYCAGALLKILEEPSTALAGPAPRRPRRQR